MSLLDEFSIPNPDDSQDSPEELQEASDALRRLSEYYASLAVTRELRGSGYVGMAKWREREQERLYSALPDSWKW